MRRGALLDFINIINSQQIRIIMEMHSKRKLNIHICEVKAIISKSIIHGE